MEGQGYFRGTMQEWCKSHMHKPDRAAYLFAINDVPIVEALTFSSTEEVETVSQNRRLSGGRWFTQFMYELSAAQHSWHTIVASFSRLRRILPCVTLGLCTHRTDGLAAIGLNSCDLRPLSSVKWAKMPDRSQPFVLIAKSS
jgi:hypothetical protein